MRVGNLNYVDGAIEESRFNVPYTNNFLAFIIGEVQLFMLIFPFTSLFMAMPAIAGLEAVVNALNALLVLLSVGYLILSKRTSLSVSGIAPLLIFLSFLVISILWVHPAVKDNSITYTFRTILAIIQVLAIVQVLNEREKLFDVLKRFAIIIVILSLLFILAFPAQAVWTIDDTPRVQSFFASPNNLGQFLAFSFLVINFHKTRELHFGILILLNAILLYQFIKCDSMTSLIGSCLMVIAFQFKYFLKPLFFVIIGAGLIVPHLNKWLGSGSSNALGFANRDLTFTGRTDIWDIMFRDLENKDRMAHGFGSGGYWLTEEEFNPITTMTELGWDINQGHNGYMDILIMTGIIGLILFLFFLFFFIKNMFSRVSFEEKVVYFFSLIVLFNNITESSFFRAKHFYFILLMICYWYVYLKDQYNVIEVSEDEEQKLPAEVGTV